MELALLLATNVNFWIAKLETMPEAIHIATIQNLNGYDQLNEKERQALCMRKDRRDFGFMVVVANANLTGTINPNGAVTTFYFQYGLTAAYGSYSTTNTAATNAILAVTNLISNLSPNTTYHFRLLANNSVGTNAGVDLTFTTLAQAVNFKLSGAVQLPGGAFQFSFTNFSGLSFTVRGTTNLALPFTNWTVLGAPVESPPGQYQFTDPQAMNKATRFYRVSSP